LAHYLICDKIIVFVPFLNYYHVTTAFDVNVKFM
jgi:hypothetical protein